MQAAKYPQRMCKEPVWGAQQAYHCELCLLHLGPCASFSVKDSVERRDAWEEKNPGWEEKVGSNDLLI